MIDKVAFVCASMAIALLAVPASAEVPHIACDGEETAQTLCNRCNEGVGQACTELGVRHRYGRQGARRDRGRAGRVLLAGCHHGDPDSCTELGSLTSGRRRLQFLRLGCDGGNGDACTELGHDYERGRDLTPRDGSAAAELFERGCEGGNPRACFEQGERHLNGPREDSDVQLAAQLYRRSCELGWSYPCTLLDPDPPPVSQRFHPYLSVGVAVEFTSRGNTNGRYTHDLAFGYRQRLHRFLLRRSALQIVPEVGYSYTKGLASGEHWGILGLGLRYTADEEHDYHAFTFQAAYVVNSFERRAMGLRTGFRVGFYHDSIFMSLHHEWHRALDEDTHLFRATFTANLGALVYAIWRTQ